MRIRYERKNLSVHKQKPHWYWFKRRGGVILQEVLISLLCLAAAALIGGIMVYLYSILYSTPLLETKLVVVRGCKELTEQEVLKMAGIKRGVNIMAVNTRLVADRVKANPWVKEVHVGREYPSRIVIDVKERTALAIMKRGEDFYLVDEKGEPFKKFTMGDDVNLPVLTGFSKEEKGSPALLSQAFFLIDYLKKNPGVASLDSISEIHSDERLGLTVFTTNGMCLVLGFNNFESKLTQLPLILADLERKNMKTSYLRIDLSDPVKITVQPRKVPLPKQPAPEEGEVKI